MVTLLRREISPSSACCQFGKNHRTVFEIEFMFWFAAICPSPFEANDDLLGVAFHYCLTCRNQFLHDLIAHRPYGANDDRGPLQHRGANVLKGSRIAIV